MPPIRSLPWLLPAVTVSSLIALIVLSIVGAFMGSARAAAMFTSPVMSALWSALLVLLVVGIVFSRRPFGRPGTLAAHLGAVLVLVGGMAGSDTGHRIAAKITGKAKIPRGTMRLTTGAAADLVRTPGPDQTARLPFGVRLQDVRIERYEGDGPWRLIAETVAWSEAPQTPIDCRIGEATAIPGSDIQIELTDYHVAAKVDRSEEPGEVVIFTSTGARESVPAVGGREVTVGEPAITLRVVAVYERLVRNRRADRSAPAAFVQAVLADGTVRRRYVFADAGAPTLICDGVHVSYLPADPIVTPDRDGHVAAMRIRLLRPDGHEATRWLVAPHSGSSRSVPVASILGPPRASAEPLTLRMTRGGQQVKTARAHVQIVVDEAIAADGIVESNHPLHYGGYALHATSLDHRAGRHATMLIKSDTGMLWVYAGMALLVVGTIGRFYIRPLARLKPSR